MYTRILISEDSVFHMFTYKPINGWNIKHMLLSNFAVHMQGLKTDIENNVYFDICT